MTWVGIIALLLNEDSLLPIGDDLSGDSPKNQPNLIPKMLPLKTIIDIVIVISYMIKLHHLDFGPQVVTSNLQTLVE